MIFDVKMKDFRHKASLVAGGLTYAKHSFQKYGQDLF